MVIVKFPSLLAMLFLTLLPLGNWLQASAEEIPPQTIEEASKQSHFFTLVYDPINNYGCKAISNKFIFKNRTGSYRFKFYFDERNFPDGFLQRGSHQRNLEFRIFSFSKSTDHRTPKVKSFSYVMQNSKCESEDCSIRSYTFYLTPPFRSLDVKETFLKIDEFPWNIAVVLYDTELNREISHSSYQLTLLSDETILYNRIPGKTRYYSLPALPDSQLYDNYNGHDEMGIEYNFQQSLLVKRNWPNYHRISVGASLNINNEISVRPTFNYSSRPPLPYEPGNSFFFFSDMIRGDGGFLNFNDGFFGGSIVNLTFSVSRATLRDDILKDKFEEKIVHRFALAPGESGIVYHQAHVEEGPYEVLGRDKCGFLGRIGEKTLKLYQISFDLINVDRDKAGHPEYLKKLGEEFLPVYEYDKQ